MKAIHTPGPVRGATTWSIVWHDKGINLIVLWPDGTGIDLGYRPADKPSYPGIAADYGATSSQLSALLPEIWLPWHNNAAYWHQAETAVVEGDSIARRDPAGLTAYIASWNSIIERAAR